MNFRAPLRTIVVAGFAALLVGCAASADLSSTSTAPSATVTQIPEEERAVTANELIDHSFTSISGSEAWLSTAPITLIFTTPGTDYSLVVETACNTSSADFDVVDGALVYEEPRTSLRGCDDTAMSHENWVFDLLLSHPRIVAIDGGIRLESPDGSIDFAG